MQSFPFECILKLSIVVLADLKLQLASTDYGNFLANEPPPLQTSTIAEKATQRLVDDFNYIRSNSGGELAKFLEYMTYASSMTVLSTSERC